MAAGSGRDDAWAQAKVQGGIPRRIPAATIRGPIGHGRGQEYPANR
jgi:hypothetical protein